MTYNFSALSRAMTAQDMASYRAKYIKKVSTHSKIITGIFIALGLIGLVIFIIPQMIAGRVSVSLLVIIAVAAVIGFLAVLGVMGRRKKLARLYAFALDNNVKLIVDQSNPTYPGIIFTQGHSRSILEALVFPNGHEIGNYTYSTGSGKSRRTYNWGYMRVKLVRKLPHMVLDARKNNLFGSGVSSLPTTLTKDQVMRLEGNFNEYFTLYAPKGYERDALYVFTPDVMSALIDYGASHDIEVVDDSLIFYQKYSVNLMKEESLKKYLTILDKVSSEIIDQGDYYADERVGNRAMDMIAAPGQRLRSRMSIVTVIFIIAFIAYFIWTFFQGSFS